MDAANQPFRVPDSWSPQRRIEYLEDLVDLGLEDGEVCKTANIIARSFDWETDEQRRQIRIADAILHYVQTKVAYVPDPNDEEWYQGPVWTLAFGGDCEDLSVLVAALARCAGLNADVYWIDQPEARLNHVVSRIEVGRAYLFADASITTAFLGEHPHDAVKRSQQFDRLGLPHPRSPAMSFAMPQTRSAGQATETPASAPAQTPATMPAVRGEHGYAPESVDYLREKRIKKELGQKIMGAAFLLGIAVGVGRAMAR